MVIRPKLFARNCAFQQNFHSMKLGEMMVFNAVTGKDQFLFFRRFLLALTKFSFQEEDWALANKSMNFLDFSDIS